jgi:hypothetical protein
VRTDTDRKPSPVLPGVQPAKLRQIRPKDYLIRFALGAAVSIVAGILSKTISARFGGAFLAFPSILPASLTLIQEKERCGVLRRLTSRPSAPHRVPCP